MDQWAVLPARHPGLNRGTVRPLKSIYTSDRAYHPSLVFLAGLEIKAYFDFGKNWDLENVFGKTS